MEKECLWGGGGGVCWGGGGGSKAVMKHFEGWQMCWVICRPSPLTPPSLSPPLSGIILNSDFCECISWLNFFFFFFLFFKNIYIRFFSICVGNSCLNITHFKHVKLSWEYFLWVCSSAHQYRWHWVVYRKHSPPQTHFDHLLLLSLDVCWEGKRCLCGCACILCVCVCVPVQEHQGVGCYHTLTPARTPRCGLCYNTLTPARTPRCGLC